VGREGVLQVIFRHVVGKVSYIQFGAHAMIRTGRAATDF
jgi:hypothetical protein